MALTGFDCGFDSGFIDQADCPTIVTPDSCWAQCCPTCCSPKDLSCCTSAWSAIDGASVQMTATSIDPMPGEGCWSTLPTFTLANPSTFITDAYMSFTSSYAGTLMYLSCEYDSCNWRFYFSNLKCDEVCKYQTALPLIIDSDPLSPTYMGKISINDSGILCSTNLKIPMVSFGYLSPCTGPFDITFNCYFGPSPLSGGPSFWLRQRATQLAVHKFRNGSKKDLMKIIRSRIKIVR